MTPFFVNSGLLYYTLIQLECLFLKAGTSVWLYFPVEILVCIFKEEILKEVERSTGRRKDEINPDENRFSEKYIFFLNFMEETIKSDSSILRALPNFISWHPYVLSPFAWLIQKRWNFPDYFFSDYFINNTSFFHHCM